MALKNTIIGTKKYSFMIQKQALTEVLNFWKF